MCSTSNIINVICISLVTPKKSSLRVTYDLCERISGETLAPADLVLLYFRLFILLSCAGSDPWAVGRSAGFFRGLGIFVEFAQSTGSGAVMSVP